MDFSTHFLIGLLAILTAFAFWINRRQNYFKDLGIPYIKSIPLLGSFDDVLLGKSGFYEQVAMLYNRPEVKGQPFFGIFLYHKPALMITDLDLIKRITVKDFNNFTNRYTSSDSHDPLGHYTLFASNNPLWKTLRNKISPFFTSGKLKSMYYLLDKIGSDMVNHVEKRLDNENKVEIEAKNLAALYTIDVIASCAFGIEANCLENPDGEFNSICRSMFARNFWRSLEFSFFFMLPQAMKLLRMKAFSSLGSEFVRKTVTHVMEERQKNGIKRNDLIDTFIEIQKSEDNENKITMDMLMAQAAAFYAAGFETSSATQSFAMYHIAKDKEIQRKLREEIKDMLAKKDGKIGAEAILNSTEMPYLHQVVHETLRIYAILPVLDRVCIKPDGYSLNPFSDFKIPHGMPVYIPYFAIQRDENFFPDPMKFDPERFSPENIGRIVPFSNLPFGSGPRNCVGERLGMMQVKVGLVKLLKEFRLEPTANTPKEIILEKKAMVISSAKPLFLSLVKDPLYQSS